MIWKLIRFPALVLLILLIFIGFRQIFEGVGRSQRDIIAQSEAYKRSPGCFPRATDIDTTMPPCTYAPVTVVSMISRHEKSRVYAGGITAYDLTIRDASGVMVTYDNVWADFAAPRVPGETISAQYWQGRIRKLSAGDSHYIVATLPARVKTTVYSIGFWLFIVIGVVPLLFRLVIRYWEPRYR